MRTYDEYYKLCQEQCEFSLLTSEKIHGKNWWKNYNSNLNTPNDYDFIKPLVDKNDAPIIKNITNVYNSEWSILHHMLSQMVIDYIKNNKIEDDIYSYSININLDKPNKRWSIFLKKYDFESIHLPESEPYDFPSCDLIADENVIRKFDSLNILIYNYVVKFINKNKKDIPEMTNNINFSIDGISDGLEFGLEHTDTSFSVGWDRNGDENADELLVVSM